MISSLADVGLPETLVIVLGAAVLMALVLGLLLRSLLAGGVTKVTAAELDALRTENADLDHKLAIEELRSSRIAAVEASLAEAQFAVDRMRSSKSLIEVELATSRQEAAGMRAIEADLRERLAVVKTGLAAAEAATDTTRNAMASVETTLASRTAALEAADANVADLQRRMNGAGEQLRDLAERFEKLRNAKSAVDESKSFVEVELATSRQEAAGMRLVETDLRERLAAVETGLAVAEAATDAARGAIAFVETTLAARTAALEAADANVADLQRRIDGAGEQLRDLAERFEKLRLAKSAVDESMAAKAEALRKTEEQAGELRNRLTSLAGEFATSNYEISRLNTANATLKETIEQEKKQADEMIALLTQARADMGLEFKALAEEVMARHGESFTKLNREQMEGILSPLREKLGEFDQKVQASHVESVKERATLAEQIRNIATTGAAMSKETKGLTEALRGRSQTQGAWGEMVLGTVLERSGLRANQEYAVQQSFADEDGRRLRPDVVVNMPGGQQMVVDAKVSLTAFEMLVNAETEEERTLQLQRHLTSVRNHITTLGSKGYHNAAGTTLDYVVMFVPIEGALAAALQAEPNLILFAAEKNVAITTPTTLMIALRTIANVWQVERRNQNAEEIAIRAGKLYEKFVGFIGDMGAIDDGIAKTRVSFDKAMNKLKSGNGNLVRQVEQLKSMGGRTSKALPVSLVEAAEGQLTLAMTTHTTETEVTVETTTQLVVTAPVSDEREEVSALLVEAAE